MEGGGGGVIEKIKRPSWHLPAWKQDWNVLRAHKCVRGSGDKIPRKLLGEMHFHTERKLLQPK